MSPLLRDDPSLPRRRDDLQDQRIGDDLMVYDPRARAVHILNGTAALVYRLCDGNHDLDSMVAGLRESFNVPGERDARGDVLGAIQTFRDKLLLC